MADGIVAGAVVTVLIEAVIRYAKSALICRKVCRKLQEELELIRPDVRRIEQQMVRRRGTSAEPLAVVESWLARLKEKLTAAEVEVHRCSSGSKASLFHVKENRDLTTKIESLLRDIRKLAGDDVSRATLSSTISNGSSHSGSSHNAASFPEGSFHHSHGSPSFSSPDGSTQGFESQGSMLRRQRMAEIGSILDAENHTRHSRNLRRHSIGSFDFSKPAEQPVTHVQVDGDVAPVHYFDQHQQQFVYVTQQAVHYNAVPYVAPQNYAQQGWFYCDSNGHNVHYHG